MIEKPDQSPRKPAAPPGPDAAGSSGQRAGHPRRGAAGLRTTGFGAVSMGQLLALMMWVPGDSFPTSAKGTDWDQLQNSRDLARKGNTGPFA